MEQRPQDGVNVVVKALRIPEWRAGREHCVFLVVDPRKALLSADCRYWILVLADEKIEASECQGWDSNTASPAPEALWPWQTKFFYSASPALHASTEAAVRKEDTAEPSWDSFLCLTTTPVVSSLLY